ncbi:hypothetical protein [Methanolobus chelungpuianus]|uniref:Uncharacterized protein n=1 Tax=Methanolobus chelungpuianus TaxID=502115 RepID=A0AAE3HDP3_9EURY|nr:hypothetical protein [Methanolobus chelungpuianus]MCQ6963553.1 hypothetical protein [Methanolobus chelungpuianus]
MKHGKSGKIKLKYKLSRYVNNPKYRNYFKIIPILCILAIIFLNSGNDAGFSTDQSLKNQLVYFLTDFQNSFNFSDTTQVVTTILILIVIWTGYNYWLMNYRIIQKNKKFTEQILFAASIVVFSNHIIYNSVIGGMFDSLIFFILLYVVLASTWLIAKIVDSFNLENDLYCWGLRLIGLALLFFGFILFSSGTFAMAFSDATSSNIFWIAGICLMLLGTFSEYRSFRRHGVFVYMR